MLRDEFISRLEKLLRNMPEEDRKDVIYDYHEHIELAVKNGLNEEKVIESLGTPESIAKQYRVKKYIDKAEATGSTSSAFRAILATLGLGFFNIVFLLGPFLAICGVLLAFGISSVGVIVAGGGLVVGGLFPQLIQGIDMHVVASGMQGNLTAGLLFGGVGTMCLGGLMGMGAVGLTKGFMNVTIKYLGLNIKIIKGNN